MKNLSLLQAFGTAADLTAAMKQSAVALRRCRLGTEARRQTKRLLLSQAGYRDRFLSRTT